MINKLLLMDSSSGKTYNARSCMKLREIVIIETGAASDFLRLAVHVQGKLSRNRIIMNNDIWKGSIIKAELDNGLSMYCWNCRLSERVALYHTMIPGNHIRCSLAYNLAPRTIIARGSSPDAWANTFFSNHSSGTVFDLIPRKKIQFIYFSITKDWLIRQFGNNENLNELLQKYMSEGGDAYLFASSVQEYDAASELFEKIQTVAGSSLFDAIKGIFITLFIF